MLSAIETEYAESMSTIKKGDKVLWLTSKFVGTIWNPQREKQEIPCVVEQVVLWGGRLDRASYKLRLLKKDGTPSARFVDRGYPIEKEQVKKVEP
jgi:16S rRNA U516 pseudouridylate synthase RsuA-like enzyme